jgi:hypothetical protein
MLLPWWCAERPGDVAWVLLLAVLPAGAIGLHAAAAARGMRSLGAVFSAGSCGPMPGSVQLSWDVGLGGEERALLLEPAPSYRSHTPGRTAMLRGDTARGARTATRLMVGAAAVCALALVHAAVLLGR